MVSDLDALLALERSSFAAQRQEGAASLRRSIVSPHQEVWLLRLEDVSAEAVQSDVSSAATREDVSTEAAESDVSSAATRGNVDAGAVQQNTATSPQVGSAIAAASVLRAAHASESHPAQTASSIAAASVLRLFTRSLRIYSIAVAEPARGRGYGQLLLEHAIGRARTLGYRAASLEADAANAALLRWYGHNGFEVVRHLPDYYGKKQHGVRMRLRL